MVGSLRGDRERQTSERQNNRIGGRKVAAQVQELLMESERHAWMGTQCDDDKCVLESGTTRGRPGRLIAHRLRSPNQPSESPAGPDRIDRSSSWRQVTRRGGSASLVWARAEVSRFLLGRSRCSPNVIFIDRRVWAAGHNTHAACPKQPARSWLHGTATGVTESETEWGPLESRGPERTPCCFAIDAKRPK
jgi:hypothetical protein